VEHLIWAPLGIEGHEGYGNNLAHPWEVLETVAHDLGVSPLSSFDYIDEDFVSDRLSSAADYPDVAEAVSAQFAHQLPWHQATDGLTTVTALLHFFHNATPTQYATLANQGLDASGIEGVMWDLRACEALLTYAVAHQVRFRIEGY
jgi:hypothetical protein